MKRNLFMSKKNKLKEKAIEKIVFTLGIASLVIIGLIFWFLFKESSGVFKTLSLADLLTGRFWYPVSANPQYSIIPLILGSLLISLGAIVIAIPLGIGCAIYISQLAPKKTRMALKVIIEFLAAIPSVVLGFIGIMVLSHWVRKLFMLPTGFTALTGSIMLAFMALPTIISISDDALNALPNEYKEASLALGASKWETIVNVMLPSASSGIIASIMLGVGRAIGETMTVMMVTGNAARIPDGFLSSARTMTATIAAEMGDTVRYGTHYHSLFFIGIVLLVMTSIINITADYVLNRLTFRKPSISSSNTRRWLTEIKAFIRGSKVEREKSTHSQLRSCFHQEKGAK